MGKLGFAKDILNNWIESEIENQIGDSANANTA